MTTKYIFYSVVCFTLIACNSLTGNLVPVKGDTTNEITKNKAAPKDEILWLDSSKVIYAVDTFLTHKGKAFYCDSVIAIDYKGFLGEHTFLPLNDKGQWINTIKKSKKLSSEQIQTLHNVLGDKNSFLHPMMVSCYQPRLGIVYFKDNKVIGQSTICLSCARLESTAKLGNDNNYSSFSKQTLRRLEKICFELQLSNCKSW
jgi:hypothetical protein